MYFIHSVLSIWLFAIAILNDTISIKLNGTKTLYEILSSIVNDRDVALKTE
jgi:hypothetical protein